MPTIPRFDPPANLPDFSEAQKRAWHQAVKSYFTAAIERTGGLVGANRSQFYDPSATSTDEPSIGELAGTIPWQGFPKVIERAHGEGTDAAFEAAEPEPRAGVARVQDEYLEWFVERDEDDRITKVTFTCEPPEFWETLGEGYPKTYNGPRTETDAADPAKVAALYSQLLGQPVPQADLFTAEGKYRRLNKWNTELGIVHLTHGANTLSAEIFLAGDATILRRRADGSPVTGERELALCARFGEEDRASDPHIGHVVHQLAGRGFDLTLRNPVGLYMDRINLAGWTIPGLGGTRVPVPASVFRRVRGEDRFAVRAVCEIPAGMTHPDTDEALTLSDIEIGGVPIRFGGQIAKLITMKLVATGCHEGQRDNPRRSCVGVGVGVAGFEVPPEQGDQALTRRAPSTPEET